MALGRPTKYNPEMCEIAEDFLAEGKSLVQLASKLDVHTDTIQEWKNVYPDFSVSLRKGIMKSQAHWEDKLIPMMYSKEVNAPLVKLYFANRFGWHDKQEVSGNKEAPLQFVITSSQNDNVQNTDDDC